MPRRIDPMREGRIYQARIKKAQQLRATANISFTKGVRAGAQAARELIAEGFPETYEFESLVLHRLGIVAADHRLLRGADAQQPHYEILESARTLLVSVPPTDDEFITAAVTMARSEDEAWILHREMTELYRDDLPPERRAKLADAIALRFPA